MKVIEQSATIMFDDILTEANLMKQIERRGRICYKSEDKITEGSAEKFINMAMTKHHNTVMEMGAFSVDIFCSDYSPKSVIREVTADIKGFKFLYTHKTPDNDSFITVTGTVRAFRDYAKTGTTWAQAMLVFLAGKFPALFKDLLLPHYDRFNTFISFDFNIRTHEHTYIAVKFITNRALSHQIVRHRPCSFLQESQRYCRYDKTGDVIFIKPSVFMNDENSEEYRMWEVTCSFAERGYLRLLEMKCSPQAARLVLPNSTKTELICYAPISQWRHMFALRTTKGADPSIIALMAPLKGSFMNNGLI